MASLPKALEFEDSGPKAERQASEGRGADQKHWSWCGGQGSIFEGRMRLDISRSYEQIFEQIYHGQVLAPL
jgi:hypothetical protein